MESTKSRDITEPNESIQQVGRIDFDVIKDNGVRKPIRKITPNGIEPLVDNYIPFWRYAAEGIKLAGFTISAFQVMMCIWYELTRDETERVMCVFRDATKTTIGALYKAWELSMDPRQSFIVISMDQEVTDTIADTISQNLLFNKYSAHLRPYLNVTGKKGERTIWNKSRIKFSIPGYLNKEPQVRVTAKLDKLTGWHAGHVDPDDLESRLAMENKRKREQVKKTSNDIVTVSSLSLTLTNTPWHEDSLIRKYLYGMFMSNGEWYPPAKRDCIFFQPINEHIWQTRFTKEKIKRIRDNYIANNEEDVFRSQYLLELVSPSFGGYDPTYLKRWDGLVKYKIEDGVQTASINGYQLIDGAAYWDPAQSKQNTDISSLAVVYIDTQYNLYVHHSVWLPQIDADGGYDDQIDAIKKVLVNTPIKKLYVETNKHEGMHRYFSNRTQIKSIEVKRTTNKHQYVEKSYGYNLNNGKVYLHDNIPQNSIKQIYLETKDLGDPNGIHLDLIDSMAGAITQLMNPMGEFIGDGSGIYNDVFNKNQRFFDNLYKEKHGIR